MTILTLHYYIVLGILKDYGSYRLAIHIIDGLGLFALTVWLLEDLLNNKKVPKT